MDVLQVNAKEPNAASAFCQSLKNTGFAVLYNHPIDLNLIDDVYHEWQGFFASNNKTNYTHNDQTQAGFFSKEGAEVAKDSEVPDIKEYFQYYPWGIFPKELSDKTKVLYETLQDFAVILLNWVETSLPKDIACALSMPLSSMITDADNIMLRILHYPPLVGTEPKGAIRAAAHEDINLLTLLVGATDSGLQVQDINGHWHDVPTDRKSIAVNVGDMLEMCTQDYFKATKHRVINPNNENRSRLSMPLFLHPRPEVELKPNFTANDYLNQRLTEMGVPLKEN